jgi:Glycosyl hydrolases family 15
LTFFNNQQLHSLIRPQYTLAQLRAISKLFDRMGTLSFSSLSNGLFPAAALDKNRSYTGYSYVWVRDNIHVAHAHYSTGRTGVAVRTLRTLAAYFIQHRKRFLDIISGAAAIPMNRPHIRFDGDSLSEVQEKWAHAQNDALGYFLWMFCKLMHEGALIPTADELHLLLLFPRYFVAIRYWQDEDSGHWEETRKISASSIGVVVAGLTEFGKLLSASGPLRDAAGSDVTADTLDPLIQHGRAALASILPWECSQPDAIRQRRYDAALLFLVYPLQIVEGDIADQILTDVVTHLQGEAGIRRYLGDSYWAPDYKKKLPPSERTADLSDDLSARDRLLPAIGQEAQWCLFDPIVSCIFGLKFKSTRSPEHVAQQARYLNRSFSQITGSDQPDLPAFRCPELYYLESGRYVPNDHVPLLWTQANLLLAMKFMEDSCDISPISP